MVLSFFIPWAMRGRKTRHLVRNSPLKQNLVLLLDLLELGKEGVDDFPEQGYTPE
jgi:hypothetical protein